LYFPIIENLFSDEGTKITKNSQRIIRGTGKKLVANKKAAILAEKSCASEIREKDILSLLIKSNLSSDPSKRMSDDELLDQLSTFLFAGSDSTALAISWCIHLLSLHLDVQSRLRQELLSFSLLTPPSYPESTGTVDGISHATPPPTASPTYSFEAHADAIDNLSFLDSVVRETLRLCPPVHSTIRVATSADTIPVSTPVTMRDGSVVDSITIGKGSFVHIPIEGLNMSKDVWGEDAAVFNPDRWSCLPKSARPPNHPGIANLMTFSFGPHSCPGAKFSIVEMKIFLATLLPYFTFEPVEKICKYNVILTRPFVYDAFDLGPRLPIKVGRYCN
jgi:cytochrome P450